MKEVSYKDSEGRLWATLLPDDAPGSDAPLGIPLGPPSLDTLGLPLETEIRLHNQLFSRRIFKEAQAQKSKNQVLGALQGALKLDVLNVLAVYRNVEKGYNSGSTEGEEEGATQGEPEAT